MKARKDIYQIAVLSGDGIGPEIVEQAVRTLKAIETRFGHTFQLNYVDFGAVSIDHNGIPFTDQARNTCLASDAVLLGAIGDPKYDNDPTIKVRPEQGLLQLRKDLGLYSNIRPLKIYDSLKEISPLKMERIENVDIEMYRELTGGIYFGEKSLNEEGTIASDLCTYSVMEIERIAIKAFEAAQKRSKKITLVDKANVLETSRLWRKVVQRLSVNYLDVETKYMFIDNAAMQLIVNPSQFDVILTENLFGDILSDEASVISGSIGLLPSASIGDNHALFEPIHGSYPEAKGKGIANPIATILSVAMMMDYFDLAEEAEVIRVAVEQVVNAKILTPDLNERDCFSTQLVGEIISYLVEDSSLSIECSFEKMRSSLLTII